jgi:hypothetical protein
LFPSRFVRLREARLRFGDRVDRLGPYLTRVDPLADAVVEAIERMPPGAGAALFDRMAHKGAADAPEAPEAMRAFFAANERPPVWVDWDVVDRGGQVLLRAGPLGGLVLGLRSLVLAYTSPAGNKPLVFSGRLAESAPRRLNETARFVRETILPGNLRPGADGWRVTLKVRLIHAQVRRMILRSGRWNAQAWGAPINQHDELGTSLLFSVAVLEGLRTLGMRVSPADGEAYMHLWRWSGWLMGVDPELAPATETEAVRLGELIAATQESPDEDSRTLTRALIESPLQSATTDRETRAARRAVRFSSAMCRMLVGDETADRLGVPQAPWSRAWMPWLRRAVSGMDRLRDAVSFVGPPAVDAGTAYWNRVVEVGLTDATAAFILPEQLHPMASRDARVPLDR